MAQHNRRSPSGRAVSFCPGERDDSHFNQYFDTTLASLYSTRHSESVSALVFVTRKASTRRR